MENKESVNTENEAVENSNAEIVQNESEALSASDRLLRESKAWKSKYQEINKKLTQIEKEKLDAQGKEKERAEFYQKKYETLHKNFMVKNIESAVSSIATRMGCTKPKALLALGDAKLMQYDEETGEVIGADDFVARVKEEYPELFATKGQSNVNLNLPKTTKVVQNGSNNDLMAKAVKGTTSDFARALMAINKSKQ